MHAFNAQGVIQLYESSAEIIEEYFPVRLELYYRRREELIKKSRYDELMTSSKARFIEDILSSTLSLTQANSGPSKTGGSSKTRVVYKSYEELTFDLVNLGYLTEEQITERSRNVYGQNDASAVDTDIAVAEKIPSSGTAKGYNYLLNMPIHSFTKDRVDRLQQSAADAKTHLDIILNHTTPEDMWLQELQVLRKEIEKYFSKTD